MFPIDILSHIVSNLCTRDKRSNHGNIPSTSSDCRADLQVITLLDVPIQTSFAETSLGKSHPVTMLSVPEPTRSSTGSSTLLKEEEDGDEEDVIFYEDRDEPSLTMSDSSDSFSSMDDLCPTSWLCEEEKEVAQQSRRVSFHPHVEVREYSLTISDHPYCEDPYPISLDWAYAGPYLRYIDHSKNRGAIYNPGRRLDGAEAKRRRLAAVRGCSEMDIDAMVTARVPSPSNYQFASSLGRSILSYISAICLPTVTPTARTLNQQEYLADDDDDEYLLLYTGTTSNSVTTRSAVTLQDLDDGYL